jgi:hypothetical protein
VRVEASSGAASVRSEIIEIVVASDGQVTLESEGAEEEEEGDLVVPVLVAVVVLVLGGAVGLARRMRA